MDVDVDYGQSKAAMLQLNDDCLEHIFKMLSFRDQIQLARVCKRSRDVWLIIHRLDFKVFNMNRFYGWIMRDILAFFKMAGPIIRTIIGDFDYQQNRNNRILEMITNFCPNVNTISFDPAEIKLSCLLKCLPQMESVTALEFESPAIDDKIAEAIAKMRNLEILTILYNDQLKGEHLHKLINIKHLNLNGCTKIRRMHFFRMCKTMTELKSLNIQGCREFSKATITRMVKNCKNLQILKTNHTYACIAFLPSLTALELLLDGAGVSTLQSLLVALVEHTQQLEYLKIRIIDSQWYRYKDMQSNTTLPYNCAELIARLRKLKFLGCTGNGNFNDNYLCKFAELLNLEEIHIAGYQPTITDEGLMILLRNCTKLKHVNVTGCVNITNAFVVEATKLLDQRYEQQKEPLVVHVANTGISQSFTTTKTKSKLKLSFVVPDTKDRSLTQLNCDLWYTPLQQLNCNNSM